MNTLFALVLVIVLLQVTLMVLCTLCGIVVVHDIRRDSLEKFESLSKEAFYQETLHRPLGRFVNTLFPVAFWWLILVGVFDKEE